MTRPAFEYVDRAVDLSPWIRDSPSWGKWYLRRGDDGAATISRVGLVIDVGDVTVSKRERVATAIYAAVDDWCALVIDWLEAGLGQALRLPSSQGGIDRLDQRDMFGRRILRPARRRQRSQCSVPRIGERRTGRPLAYEKNADAFKGAHDPVPIWSTAWSRSCSPTCCSRRSSPPR